LDSSASCSPPPPAPAASHRTAASSASPRAIGARTRPWLFEPDVDAGTLAAVPVAPAVDARGDSAGSVALAGPGTSGNGVSGAVNELLPVAAGVEYAGALLPAGIGVDSVEVAGAWVDVSELVVGGSNTTRS